MQARNQYLDCLIYPSFQGVNRIFVLSFEDNAVRTTHIGYFLPKVKVKYYNVLIDARNTFDQPVKKDIRTYDKICKTATGQRSKIWLNNWLFTRLTLFQRILIAIDLRKQQALDADLKAIQLINFTGNLDRKVTIFFIIVEAKQTSK